MFFSNIEVNNFYIKTEILKVISDHNKDTFAYLRPDLVNFFQNFFKISGFIKYINPLSFF